METERVVLCVDEVKKIDSEDISRENVDVPRYQKKKKTRRGRAKRRNCKPYSKPSKLYSNEKRVGRGLSLSSSQEKEQLIRPSGDVHSETFIHGQPVAPYNTTQFLMDDHNSFPDLDVQLQAAGLNRPRPRPSPANLSSPSSRSNLEMAGISVSNKTLRPSRSSRARVSTFSVETDDGYFYSSPEDEEEFLTKEFSNTYQDLHAERLGSLSKSQLIVDYVQLEEKVNSLEKRLQEMDAERMGQSSSTSEEAKQGNLGVSLGLSDRSPTRNLDDLSKKVFQEEMNKLSVENDRLSRENEHLRHLCRKVGLCVEVMSVSSSVDSESDSSSSSYSSISNSSSSSDRTLSKDDETSPSEPLNSS